MAKRNQEIPEAFVYADKAKQSKYKNLLDKVRGLASTVEGRIVDKENKYEDFSIKTLSKFIDDVNSYKKDATQYQKAKRLMKEGKMDATGFSKRYEDNDWARFDSKNVKEKYNGEWRESDAADTKEKEKQMWITDAVLEMTGAPALSRVLKDPLGTAGAVGNTVADLAVTSTPMGWAYDKFVNDTPDVNPITGNPYWTGVDKTVDLASIIPAGAGIKALTTGRKVINTGKKVVPHLPKGLSSVAKGEAKLRDAFKPSDLTRFESTKKLAELEKKIASGTADATDGKWYTTLQENKDAIKYAKDIEAEELLMNKIPGTKATHSQYRLDNLAKQLKDPNLSIADRSRIEEALSRSIPNRTDVTNNAKFKKYYNSQSSEMKAKMDDAMDNPETYWKTADAETKEVLANKGFYSPNEYSLPTLQSHLFKPTTVEQVEELLPPFAGPSIMMKNIAAERAAVQGSRGIEATGPVSEEATVPKSPFFKLGGEMSNDISKMGYRDDSQYRNEPFIDIDTQGTGLVDMSNTGIDIDANGVKLKAYSGMHQVPVDEDGIVRESRLVNGGPLGEPDKPVNKKKKKVEDTLLKYMNEYGITNPYMQQALMGVVMAEGGLGGSPEKSWKNTSNDRIREYFGARVSDTTDSELSRLKKDNTKFFDKIYGPDAMDYYKDNQGWNPGNDKKGDGWKYRGRGLNQLTFKSSYDQMQKDLKKRGYDYDLVGNPDLLDTDPDLQALVAVNFLEGRLAQIPKLAKNNPDKYSDLAGYQNYNEDVTSFEDASYLLTRANAGWGKEVMPEIHHKKLKAAEEYKWDTDYKALDEYKENQRIKAEAEEKARIMNYRSPDPVDPTNLYQSETGPRTEVPDNTDIMNGMMKSKLAYEAEFGNNPAMKKYGGSLNDSPAWYSEDLSSNEDTNEALPNVLAMGGGMITDPVNKPKGPKKYLNTKGVNKAKMQEWYDLEIDSPTTIQHAKLLAEAVGYSPNQANVVAGQWALESGRGKHVGGDYNYFGIKSHSKAVRDKLTSQYGLNVSANTPKATSEQDKSGKKRNIKSSFLNFENPIEAFFGHKAFLETNPRYADALKEETSFGFASAIKDAGYATSVNYVKSLGNIIKPILDEQEAANFTKRDLHSGHIQEYQKLPEVEQEKLAKLPKELRYAELDKIYTANVEASTPNIPNNSTPNVNFTPSQEQLAFEQERDIEIPTQNEYIDKLDVNMETPNEMPTFGQGQLFKKYGGGLEANNTDIMNSKDKKQYLRLMKKYGGHMFQYSETNGMQTEGFVGNDPRSQGGQGSGSDNPFAKDSQGVDGIGIATTAAQGIGNVLSAQGNDELTGAQKSQQTAQAINSTAEGIAGSVLPWMAAANAASDVATGLVVDQVVDPETGLQESQDKGWSSGFGKEAEAAIKPVHTRAIEDASEGDWIGAAGEILSPGVMPLFENITGETRENEEVLTLGAQQSGRNVSRYGGNLFQIANSQGMQQGQSATVPKITTDAKGITRVAVPEDMRAAWDKANKTPMDSDATISEEGLAAWGNDQSSIPSWSSAGSLNPIIPAATPNLRQNAERNYLAANTGKVLDPSIYGTFQGLADKQLSQPLDAVGLRNQHLQALQDARVVERKDELANMTKEQRRIERGELTPKETIAMQRANFMSENNKKEFVPLKQGAPFNLGGGMNNPTLTGEGLLNQDNFIMTKDRGDGRAIQKEISERKFNRLQDRYDRRNGYEGQNDYTTVNRRGNKSVSGMNPTQDFNQAGLFGGAGAGGFGSSGGAGVPSFMELGGPMNNGGFGANTMNELPITVFNEGGKHADNPNGGIPQGRDNEGRVNLVEQGELKFPDPRDPSGENKFIVSADKKMKLTKALVEKHELPKKYIGKTVLDIANKILRKGVARDSITNNSIDLELLPFVNAHADLSDIMNAKQKENFNAELANLNNKYPGMMPPPQGEPSPEEMAMMQQQGAPAQPFMYGGNMFQYSNSAGLSNNQLLRDAGLGSYANDNAGGNAGVGAGKNYELTNESHGTTEYTEEPSGRQSLVNAAAQLLPAGVNIASGLFGKKDTMDAGRAGYRKLDRINPNQQLREAGYSEAALRKAIKSGASGGGGYLANSMNAKILGDRNRAQIHNTANNANTQISNSEQQLNAKIESENLRRHLIEEQYGKGSEAAKRAMLNAGISQIAQYASSQEKNELARDYNRMYSEDFTYDYKAPGSPGYFEDMKKARLAKKEKKNNNNRG